MWGVCAFPGVCVCVCVAQRRKRGKKTRKKKKPLGRAQRGIEEYVTVFTCLAHEFTFLPHTYHTCLNAGPRKHANHTEAGAKLPHHNHTATYAHATRGTMPSLDALRRKHNPPAIPPHPPPPPPASVAVKRSDPIPKMVALRTLTFTLRMFVRFNFTATASFCDACGVCATSALV